MTGVGLLVSRAYLRVLHELKMNVDAIGLLDTINCDGQRSCDDSECGTIGPT